MNIQYSAKIKIISPKRSFFKFFSLKFLKNFSLKFLKIFSLKFNIIKILILVHFKINDDNVLIAKSIKDVVRLASMGKDLVGSKVIFEGLIFTKKFSVYVSYIVNHGKLKMVSIINCIFKRECYYLLSVFASVDLSITHCNLTAEEGLNVLLGISPYSLISVDLSNNNLNYGKGKKQFLKEIKSCISTDCLSHLNISGNCFSPSDLSDLGNNDIISI